MIKEFSKTRSQIIQIAASKLLNWKDILLFLNSYSASDVYLWLLYLSNKGESVGMQNPEWIDTVATIVPYLFEMLSVAIWLMEFEIRHQNIDVAIVMLYVLFSRCFISL